MTSDPAAKDGSGHTPAPWRVHVDEVFGADGYQVMRFNGYGSTDQANARRIVACVNACEGIGTETLEAGLFHSGPAALADRDRLRERVKELESALQKIANHDGVSEIIARVALSKSPK